jgi:hypothetical protein
MICTSDHELRPIRLKDRLSKACLYNRLTMDQLLSSLLGMICTGSILTH